MENLYTRQDELDLEPPYTATVIGCGGVGSWVALDLALAGVQKLYVVDHDHIETHNLNRTPFKQEQIGMDKTSAIVELVAERRIDTEVVPINKRVEETAGTFREDMADSVIIDCRDHASELPEDLQKQILMTAGYDGYEYTLHTNPDYGEIWGDEETEYETVPSFVAPPQFVSSIITTVTCSPDLRTEAENYRSGNMKDLIKNLFTDKEEKQGSELLYKDLEIPKNFESDLLVTQQ